MLVDTHCHLDFPDFQDDLDDVVSRAGEAGVGLMMSIGTHITKAPQVLAIAERYDNVYCTVGIHPHNAGDEPEVTTDQLIELAKPPKVVGFGETGLDYFYDHSPRDIQQSQFRTHLQASREAGLPVVVHTRDAEDDTMAILEDEMGKGAFTGLVHCFSGSQGLADKAVELGLYVSFSGILTFKSAAPLRDVAATVPLDSLLVETDAPYLAPVPKRGKRNEPAYTAHTAAVLAEVKGISTEGLATATTDNFHRLFTQVPRS